MALAVGLAVATRSVGGVVAADVVVKKGLAGVEGFDEFGEHLVDVADNAEIGDREDRSLLVLVDGDDVFGALHADEVLGGTGDATGDVNGGLDDLSGLADLVAVGHPAGIDDGAAGTGGGTGCGGELFDHGVGLGRAQATTTGDDHGGFVELGTLGLFGGALDDFGGAGVAEFGHGEGVDRSGAATGGGGFEGFGAHEPDTRSGAGEGRDDVFDAAEDGFGALEGVVGDFEIDDVGQHGRTEFDREAGSDVTSVVGGAEHEGIRGGAIGHGGCYSRGDCYALHGFAEVAGGVDGGCAMVAEFGGDARGVGAAEDLNGVCHCAGFGEHFESDCGYGTVAGFAVDPDFVEHLGCVLFLVVLLGGTRGLGVRLGLNDL